MGEKAKVGEGMTRGDHKTTVVVMVGFHCDLDRWEARKETIDRIKKKNGSDQKGCML